MLFNPDEIFSPEKYILIRDVPLLDEHEAEEGKDFKVTPEILNKIATRGNERWNSTGDATPFVLGHTLDHAPESSQPEILGFFVNFQVHDFFNTGRKAVFGDLYLKKDKKQIADANPRRSVELWKNKLEIDPVSALGATSPERDLSLLLFKRNEEIPYRYSITDPTLKGLQVNPETPMNPTVVAAQKGETATSKGLEAEIKALSQKFDQFMSMFMEAMQGDHEGEDKSDLLAPVDGEGDDEGDEEEEETPPTKDKGKKKEKGKDTKDKEDMEDMEDDEPVKFDASATNCYVPSTETKDVKKMAREEDAEVLKFKRELANTQAELAEHKLKFQRIRAEKMVGEWETKHFVEFPSEEDKNAEIEMMAHLDDESLGLHEKRALKLYGRKTPNGNSLANLQKFARLPDQTKEASMEEAQKQAEEALKSGKTYQQWLQEKAKK